MAQLARRDVPLLNARRSSTLATLLLVACGGKDLAPSDDTDTDTDADTDADTATPSPFFPVRVTSLTGDLSYTSVLDGVPRCDLLLELALDPDGSLDLMREWSAPVSSTIARNDGNAECESIVLAPEEVFLALRSPDPTVDVGLSYEPPAGDYQTRLFSYTVTGDTGAALQIAHGHNHAHYEDDNILQVDEIWPPGFLAWNSSLTVDVSSGVSDWYDDCGSDVDSSTVAPLAETAMVKQTLHPADNRIDVWELVMPAREQVQLRIATDVEASQPFLWINERKGCTYWQASGNVHCNADDPGTSCPAIWTTLVAGTYEVAVRGGGKVDVPYELWYELPAGATLEILEDDIQAPPDQRYEITTFGTVEVKWEKR